MVPAANLANTLKLYKPTNNANDIIYELTDTMGHTKNTLLNQSSEDGLKSAS